jgi:hypothetical protein
MAEGVGFEPTVRFHAQRFSRPSQSTTLPPLRVGIFGRAAFRVAFWRQVSSPNQPQGVIKNNLVRFKSHFFIVEVAEVKVQQFAETRPPGRRIMDALQEHDIKIAVSLKHHRSFFGECNVPADQ